MPSSSTLRYDLLNICGQACVSIVYRLWQHCVATWVVINTTYRIGIVSRKTCVYIHDLYTKYTQSIHTNTHVTTSVKTKFYPLYTGLITITTMYLNNIIKRLAR